jgi:hypothetical protein
VQNSPRIPLGGDCLNVTGERLIFPAKSRVSEVWAFSHRQSFGGPFFCFESGFGRFGRVNSIDESVTKLCPPRVGSFDVDVLVLTGLMKV